MTNKLYLALIIMISLLLTACINEKKPPTVEEPIEQPITENTVKPPIVELEIDSIEMQINRMTLEEKVGQLMIVGIEGTEINVKDVENIKQNRIGGFILFSRNIENLEQTLQLLNSLKNINSTYEIPLLLSVDEEGGTVSRLSKIYKNLPSPLLLGHKNDLKLSFEYGKNLGMKARSLGFNMNFAPVLDINSNPENTVIGNRAYGKKAELVSRVGEEVIEGIRSQNIIAVAKHFPGHGDTLVDSHFQLPMVDKSIDELYNLEIIPFKKAINKGLNAIMVAHVLYPQIDNEFPATMSEKIINDILRVELEFDGLIISDDMTMGAIIDNYTIEEASVQFLKSGGDIILICHGNENVDLVYNKILESVNKGILTEDEIDEKVYRILEIKNKYKIRDSIINNVNIEEINSNTERLIKNINS
ncbi:MAG: beta-N-acetylhexosaminidase [Tissierellia bacterium]|nr:beta-N-acetylhexosaminidase [Tissierellia bacterium]